MTRNIIAIFFFCLTLSACGQAKNSSTVNGLTIDPNIKNEVEKHIETSKEFDAFKDKMPVYGNSILAESYQDDSLIFSSNDIKNKQLFKSFYFWKGDTLTIDGALIFRLEVPCTDTKIILSEVPDSTKKQIIYGYVEFKSGNYYVSSGSANGHEILPRQKLRNNMKIYFKSGYLDL